MRHEMLLQVRWVLALEHRRAMSAVSRVHLTDAHVRIWQILKMFPDGTATSSPHVLRVSAPINVNAASGEGVRRHTQSVNFRVEALDVFL